MKNWLVGKKGLKIELVYLNKETNISGTIEFVFYLISIQYNWKRRLFMAICHEMNEGDVFFCKLCGLELRVEKTCSCGTGEDACSVPLQCCGQDMTKK